MERIAARLAALGVERGDVVALMLVNRPECHLVDTAVLHLGATPFSVYNTSTPEQVAHQFANAGNRVVVTERHFLPVVRSAGATEIVPIEELEQLEARAASASPRRGRRCARRTSRRSSTPRGRPARRRASS